MKTQKQLNREAIDEFRAAYYEEFGRNLSDEETKVIAFRLLRIFGILQNRPSKPGRNSAGVDA